MYSEVRQWKRIRNRALLSGESRRAVAASEQISRNTLRKMLALEVPPRFGTPRARDGPDRSDRKQDQTRRHSSLDAVNQRWAEWLCLIERGSGQAVQADRHINSNDRIQAVSSPDWLAGTDPI